MLRYCPNCGTEVDDTALFCPTCGQAVDQAAETAMPPAPAWPEPEPPPPPPPAPAAWDEPEPAPAPAAPPPPPPPAGALPSAAPPAMAPRDGGEPASPSQRAGTSLPVSAPVMLSGWLIGGGAAVGALGALVALFDGSGTLVEFLVLVILVVIAVSVFAAAALPAIPHLRLATLVAALIAFGVALDRIGFGSGGVGMLLVFLGSAAAAIGGIILEIGRDQPVRGT